MIACVEPRRGAADDCPQAPEALQADMPVEVGSEKLDDEIALPLFRPARR
jgi:uncharacterized protein